MAITLKLGIAAGVVIAATVYMAYLGSRSSWQYYLSVEEVLRDATELTGRPIRVSGSVVANSISFSPGNSAATFQIGKENAALAVRCGGPLPDNLEDGAEVVVEGFLDESGILAGDKVLTRCASKYRSEPPVPSVKTASSQGRPS